MYPNVLSLHFVSSDQLRLETTSIKVYGNPMIMVFFLLFFFTLLCIRCITHFLASQNREFKVSVIIIPWREFSEAPDIHAIN